MTCKACGEPFGCGHSDAEYQGVVPLDRPLPSAGLLPGDPRFNTVGEFVAWKIQSTQARSRARRDGRTYTALYIARQIKRVRAGHSHLFEDRPADV